MRPVLNAWGALIAACRAALAAVDNQRSHTPCFPNLDGCAPARPAGTLTDDEIQGVTHGHS